jgi:hypothetical protein
MAAARGISMNSLFHEQGLCQYCNRSRLIGGVSGVEDEFACLPKIEY